MNKMQMTLLSYALLGVTIMLFWTGFPYHGASFGGIALGVFLSNILRP